MPNITFSQQELKPLYTRIPNISDLKLNQTLKTIVVCRVCRGERVVAVKSDTCETFTYTKCFNCNGTGMMEN